MKISLIGDGRYYNRRSGHLHFQEFPSVDEAIEEAKKSGCFILAFMEDDKEELKRQKEELQRIWQKKLRNKWRKKW